MDTRTLDLFEQLTAAIKRVEKRILEIEERNSIILDEVATQKGLAVGNPMNAIVTAVWGYAGMTNLPLINLVAVSLDDKKTDGYGRQIERYTSVMHKAQSSVHGYYWRFEDETPNQYVAPLER